MSSASHIEVRARGEIRGTQRLVRWSRGRFTGDREWIARVERTFGPVAEEGVLPAIHALEDVLGGPIDLLIIDDEAAETVGQTVERNADGASPSTTSTPMRTVA